MTTIFGTGDCCYELEDGWAKLPPGWKIGDVGGVAVDSRDNVFVFNRGEHPMLVFDKEGNFLRSWGEGLFTRPHGLDIGPDDAVYCTDDGDHTVRKCSPDGRVLLTLSTPGRPAPYLSNRPFNRCTHTALSPQGDIYVTDGYGNARVHKFSPDGRHLLSWGDFGIGPGEFNIPHNICTDRDGLVYVADRENHRVQVFDGEGRYRTQWGGLHRPCALCGNRSGPPLFYVGETGPGMPLNKDFPRLGPRISILNPLGEIVARFADAGYGAAPDRFLAPHGMAVNSRGDIFVGEVAHASWGFYYPDRPAPPDLRTFRKLKKRTVSA